MSNELTPPRPALPFYADMHPADLEATEAPTRPPLALEQQRITDNLEQLLEILPPGVRAHLEGQDNLDNLLEIVMDLGRIPEARFPNDVVELGGDIVSDFDLEYVTQRVGTFGKDNRAGIERTLHRISAIRNRQGRVIGLTCRIGRAVYGTIDIISDVVQAGKSILMLGRPGRGKTTKLREVARVQSDELKKRVVIVDTSNEIGGDGDIPHPAIGRARRMQVAAPELQHAVMIEAVENHMPEVIVIDEIGTEQEAFAARTIAERGVQLVGTAHGNSLENLMMNPTLSDLVGGIHAVTLSDDEAKRRGTQKTVLERKAPPTFDVIIEIMEVDKLAIHHDVEKTVDRMLRGQAPRPEIRVRNEAGEIEVVQRADDGAAPKVRELPEGRGDDRAPRNGRGERWDRANGGWVGGSGGGTLVPRNGRGRPGDAEADEGNASRAATPPVGGGAADRNGGVKALPSIVRIFPYGVSRSRLDRAITEGRLPALVARDVSDADAVLALKASYKNEPGKMRDAAQKRLPVYVVRSNTYAQIASAVRELFGLDGGSARSEEEEMEDALQEAHEAIESVMKSAEAVELAPANAYTRRLQHQLAERFALVSESVGVEPQRRVRILPQVMQRAG